MDSDGQMVPGMLDRCRAGSEGELKNNICIRCGLLVAKPYKYHYACEKEAEQELRAKIEALPKRTETLEVWCRMWGMTLEEGCESYANWTKTHE